MSRISVHYVVKSHTRTPTSLAHKEVVAHLRALDLIEAKDNVVFVACPEPGWLHGQICEPPPLTMLIETVLDREFAIEQPLTHSLGHFKISRLNLKTI
jgi:hypothetical protein